MDLCNLTQTGYYPQSNYLLKYPILDIYQFLKMKKTHLILLFAFGLITNAFSQHIPSDSLFHKELKGFPDVGEVAIGIYNKGDVITQGFTFQDGNLIAKENAKAIFDIGSITKTFTGALMMKAITEGTIQLEDPIDKHLPFDMRSNSYEGQTVNLYHLATHTAALDEGPSSFTLPYLRAKIFKPQNTNQYFKTKQYYKYLQKAELESAPGQQWKYSNAGLSLLGHIVAQAQQSSWEQILQVQIFDHLGMENSSCEINTTQQKWLVPGYSSKGKRAAPWQNMDFIDPAGAIKSNVEDMLKYLAANIRPEDHGMAYLNELHQPIQDEFPLPGSFSSHKMGLTWIHYTSTKGNNILWHNGATGGYKSFMAFDKEREIGVVILSNVHGRHPQARTADGKSIVEELGFKMME